MFDPPPSGNRALLVHIDLGVTEENKAIEEFRELAASGGGLEVGLIRVSRRTPDPKHYIGSGKAEEIRRQVEALSAELVIFDQILSPSQERNLERLCHCRVLDRTGLILDIFAQRARSHEGKLQVELAQLHYLSTRLVRGWSHLERQKGGIGLRGPGEKQLETDRRLLAGRIKQIGKRLDKVRRQRQQSRSARAKAEVATVSLVGYTNAGKSTLFNHLTHAEVYSADALFATLDPTLRKLEIDNGEHIVLADTVGFIRQLPHDLVAAFRATLQETREADLLLHVVDAADDHHAENMDCVDQVLTEIEADEVPRILVYNKTDLLGSEPRLERDAAGGIIRVWLSAATGEGTELLRQALAERFSLETVRGWLNLPPQAGRLRARLFAMGAVLTEEVDHLGTCHLEIEMPRRRFEDFSREHLPDHSLMI